MSSQKPWLPGGGQALIAAVSGLVSAAAFAPFDLWPLALLGLAPLAWLLWDLSPRRAFVATLIFGTALRVAQLTWLTHVMTVYGGMAWPLAALVLVLFGMFLGLFMALAGWAAALGRQMGLSPLVGLPLAWAGQEWLLEWAFSGFPWLPWSVGLAPVPPLVQSAELWGAHGLSAAAVLVCCLIARAARGFKGAGRAGSLAALAAAVILVAGGWLWGQQRMEQVRAQAKAAPKLSVTVVQGDIDLYQLWAKDQRLNNLMRQIKLSREAASPGVRRPWLIVWPESAAPFFFLRQGRPSAPVLDAARELRAYIALGSEGALERDGGIYPTNRAWLVGPDGRPRGFYDKVHLVPFGEYVPWPKLLFFVRAVAVIGVDFAPGGKGDLLDAGPVVIGPLICYESIFQELARAQVLRGAQLLINQTNDAWFGPTGASLQHASHLVLRAVENRRAVARSANTGVSCFVMPDGEVKDATGLFTPAWRTRRLPLMSGRTLFTSMGPLVGPAGGALILALCAAAIWRARGKGRGEE